MNQNPSPAAVVGLKKLCTMNHTRSFIPRELQAQIAEAASYEIEEIEE